MATIDTVLELSEFYEKHLSDFQMRTYLAALDDIDEVALELAAMEWIKTEKWFPKPAELRTKVSAAYTMDDPIPVLWEEWDSAHHGTGWSKERMLSAISRLRSGGFEATATRWADKIRYMEQDKSTIDVSYYRGIEAEVERLQS